MPRPDGRIGHRDLCNGAVVERVIADGSVASLKISATIQSDNFSSGSAGWQINRVTGSAEFQDVVVRGTLNADDIVAGTIDAGVITVDNIDAANITTGSLSASRIAAGTITSNHIASNTITAGDIAANAITTSELAANSVTASEIQANSVTASEIAANTITASQIASNTITASQIAANAITTSELAANSVTSSKIVAGSITSSDIQANTITGGDIAADTITAGQIASGAISTGELAANAVTASRIAANSVNTSELVANSVTATEINVATLSAISVNAGNITAGTITGLTITGGTVRTAASGTRVQMTSGSTNDRITFHNGSSQSGYIQGVSGGQMVVNGTIVNLSASSHVFVGGHMRIDQDGSGHSRLRAGSGNQSILKILSSANGTQSRNSADTNYADHTCDAILRNSEGAPSLAAWKHSVREFDPFPILMGAQSKKWKYRKDAIQTDVEHLRWRYGPMLEDMPPEFVLRENYLDKTNEVGVLWEATRLLYIANHELVERVRQLEAAA